MSEHLPSASPEEQSSSKLAHMREALRQAAESRRDDERRGAAYLNTGAYADSNRYSAPESEPSGTSIDLSSLHERAAEARASGDQRLLAELQAEQDAWQAQGTRQGKRRIYVDVSRAPAEIASGPNSEPKHDAFISPDKPGSLEDAYRIRREESLRITSERQDFAEWEAQIASSNLSTAAMAFEALPANHETLETPDGAVETDTVVLDDEVRIVLATNESAVVEREEITDRNTGEQHVVETTMTEEGTEITIDDEPIEAEDLPMIEALNAHIVESVNRSRTEIQTIEDEIELAEDPETPAEAEPAPQESEKPKPTAETKAANPSREARGFFQAMKSNLSVREQLDQTLRERNLSNEQFNEVLDKATVEDLAKMRKLFTEAGPKSSIWAERPGPSALGRASRHYKDTLSAIVTGIIER